MLQAQLRLQTQLQTHLERGDVDAAAQLREQNPPTLGMLISIGDLQLRNWHSAGLNALVRTLDPQTEVAYFLREIWNRTQETLIFDVGAACYPRLTLEVCESIFPAHARTWERHAGTSSCRATDRYERQTLEDLATHVTLASLVREMTEASERGEYWLEEQLTFTFMLRIGTARRHGSNYDDQEIGELVQPGEN